MIMQEKNKQMETYTLGFWQSNFLIPERKYTESN